MGTITFIIGGARSGKSRYAHALAREHKGSIYFVATAEAHDGEMRKRIGLHRKERPSHWKTVEEPRDVPAALRRIPRSASCVILDCLTLLVSNCMLAGKTDAAIEKEARDILRTFRTMAADGIIVSNEVGMGIVPDNELARRFRDIAGKANQIAAKNADRVVLMAAGIPVTIK